MWAHIGSFMGRNNARALSNAPLPPVAYHQTGNTGTPTTCPASSCRTPFVSGKEGASICLVAAVSRGLFCLPLRLLLGPSENSPRGAFNPGCCCTLAVQAGGLLSSPFPSVWYTPQKKTHPSILLSQDAQCLFICVVPHDPPLGVQGASS
jgi:hypothetical protein